MDLKDVKIAVIGLGYVGLPLARLFSTKYKTVGFDMNAARCAALMAGHDATLEVSDELLQDAINNHGRKLVSSDLVNTNGVYTVDFVDFEKQIVDNNVKLFILSSPHNPAGRVWKREELEQMLQICRKHNVFVVADEIHHDLIMPGYEHTEILNIKGYEDMLVAITAGSKTFNLAGCQNSYVILPDEKLRAEYDAFMADLRMGGGNAFGNVAVEAAFGGGREWLEAVIAYVEKNAKRMVEALNSYGLPATMPEGTYLIWVDATRLGKTGNELVDYLVEKARVHVQSGEPFGAPNWFRLNMATPAGYVDRMIEGFKNV